MQNKDLWNYEQGNNPEPRSWLTVALLTAMMLVIYFGFKLILANG